MKPSSFKGVCALCRSEQYLCRSHLLPAALYRLCINRVARNPNPILFTSKRIVLTSSQLAHHLLCVECETRFRTSGEDWMMSHCYRGRHVFRLRDEMARGRELHSPYNNTCLYLAADTPEIEVTKLVYFASSVFWRGSVSWRIEGEAPAVPVSLGDKYAEAFRKYLLGLSGFPEHAALLVFVSSLKKPPLIVAVPLNVRKRRESSFHQYRFRIPGLTFDLFVGRTVPQPLRDLCVVRGRGNPIIVSPEIDVADFNRDVETLCGLDMVGFADRYGFPKE
jgi:hypothetical protein